MATTSTKMRVGVALDQGSHMPVSERDLQLWRQLAGSLKSSGISDVRIEVPMVESLAIGKPACWREEEKRVIRNVEILREHDLEIEAVVGFGSNGALPADISVDDSDYVKRVADNVYEVVTALRAYGVSRFQVENELSTAGQAALVQGWRTGSRWWDWNFKCDLMRALCDAARRANPDAVLTTNIFDGAVDPRRAPHEPSGWDVVRAFFGSRGSFERGIADLGQFVDEVGLDAYPNYIAPYTGGWNIGLPPEHVRPRRKLSLVGRTLLFMVRPVWRYVGARPGSLRWPLLLGMRRPDRHIERRLAAFRRAVPGKPVYVAETGVPSQSSAGHTAGGQALYIEAVLRGARRAGAARTVIYHYYDPTEADHLRYGMPADRIEEGRRPPGMFGIDANSHDQHEGKFGLLDEFGCEKRATIRRRRLVWRRGLPRIETEMREVSAADVVRNFIREAD